MWNFCSVTGRKTDEILTPNCVYILPSTFAPPRNAKKTSNAMLEAKGFATPRAIKTGTTIVGITYKDGVILGADTRATEGPIVADKNCEKIHFLAKNM